MFRCFTLLFSLLAWGALAAVPVRSQTSASTRSVAIETADLSPDGRKIVLVTATGSERSVVVRTSDGRRLASGAAGPRRVLVMDWLPGDNILMARGGSTEGGVNLITYNVARNTGAPLTTRNIMVTFSGLPVGASWRGEPVLYMPGRTGRNGDLNLYRVNLKTGAGSIVDNSGVQSAAWLVGTGGTLIARSEIDDTGWVLRVRSGERWVERARSPGRPAATPLIVGYGRDGRSLLLKGSTKDPVGWYELALETGAWTGPLGGPDGPFQRMLTVNRRPVLGDVAIGLDPVFFDPALARTWAAAKAALTGRRLRVHAVADDGSRLLLRARDGTGRTTLVYFDAQTGKAETLGRWDDG